MATDLPCTTSGISWLNKVAANTIRGQEDDGPCVDSGGRQLIRIPFNKDDVKIVDTLRLNIRLINNALNVVEKCDHNLPVYNTSQEIVSNAIRAITNQLIFKDGSTVTSHGWHFDFDRYQAKCILVQQPNVITVVVRNATGACLGTMQLMPLDQSNWFLY